jgi:hypothetical protein
MDPKPNNALKYLGTEPMQQNGAVSAGTRPILAAVTGRRPGSNQAKNPQVSMITPPLMTPSFEHRPARTMPLIEVPGRPQ